MNMESEPTKKNKREGMSVNDALVIMAGTEHMTYQLGGNDTEREQFQTLRAKVESGAITPSKGVELAEQILNSKNSNYH